VDGGSLPARYPCRSYRGTSLTRNSAPLGPYSMNMPGALWWSWGGGLFRMSEVTLYTDSVCRTDMGTTMHAPKWGRIHGVRPFW